ncbi:hypothetical protein [Pseudomonas lurida]|uniref:hypothetical protein n=1 Tax=Pseudomonas lurida TaxID=244566 RepID=UPI0030D8D7AD
MTEEGGEALAHAQALFNEPCIELDQKLDDLNTERALSQCEVDSQKGALELQADELQISQTSMQAELTRNARLGQTRSDLEIRVQEKNEQIRSLEEKHLHSREALEHYSNAVKEQRYQEQQRNEGQVRQVQAELRQLQQTLMLKQDELTRPKRDNNRLLSEARQQVKAMATPENAALRLIGEIVAIEDGVCQGRRGERSASGAARHVARRNSAAGGGPGAGERATGRNQEVVGAIFCGAHSATLRNERTSSV